MPVNIEKFSRARNNSPSKEAMSSSSNTGLSQTEKPDNIVWIEEVLMNNLEGIGALSDESGSNHENQDQAQSSISSTALNGENANSPPSQHSVQTQSPPEVKIGIAEIELKDETYLGDDRIQTLSRIVTGKIKYYVENRDEEEKFQHWIIKLPNLNHPHRELSQMIDAAKREISFYTKILPDIKSWMDTHHSEFQVEFRVPTCFYGKYHRPVDQDPDLDIITHILDSESLLVLDDLRVAGFGKRHFGTGLMMSEVFAAIEEITVFHVTTYAMQQREKRKPNWPQLYDYQRMAKLYHYLLESNYPTLQNFLTKESKHPKAKEMFMRMQKLRPQLHAKFQSLLMPSDGIFPNTLVHMDLWSENLLFRARDDSTPMEEVELDCFILDWQMVSYGRPTHDIALLVMLSMEPEYRRQHTTLILKYYYQLFWKCAVNFGFQIPFNYEVLKKEFKKSCVLATLMAMASIDMALMEESTQNRLIEALVDLVDDKLI